MESNSNTTVARQYQPLNPPFSSNEKNQQPSPSKRSHLLENSPESQGIKSRTVSNIKNSVPPENNIEEMLTIVDQAFETNERNTLWNAVEICDTILSKQTMLELIQDEEGQPGQKMLEQKQSKLFDALMKLDGDAIKEAGFSIRPTNETIQKLGDTQKEFPIVAALSFIHVMCKISEDFRTKLSHLVFNHCVAGSSNLEFLEQACKECPPAIAPFVYLDFLLYSLKENNNDLSTLTKTFVKIHSIFENSPATLGKLRGELFALCPPEQLLAFLNTVINQFENNIKPSIFDAFCLNWFDKKIKLTGDDKNAFDALVLDVHQDLLGQVSKEMAEAKKLGPWLQKYYSGFVQGENVFASIIGKIVGYSTSGLLKGVCSMGIMELDNPLSRLPYFEKIINAITLLPINTEKERSTVFDTLFSVWQVPTTQQLTQNTIRDWILNLFTQLRSRIQDETELDRIVLHFLRTITSSDNPIFSRDGMTRETKVVAEKMLSHLEQIAELWVGRSELQGMDALAKKFKSQIKDANTSMNELISTTCQMEGRDPPEFMSPENRAWHDGEKTQRINALIQKMGLPAD